MAASLESDDDLGSELKAMLAARRELGPEMDDVLVENFMRQVDAHVQRRVSQDLARRQPVMPARGPRRSSPSLHPVALILLLVLLLPLVGAVHVPVIPLIPVLFFLLFFTRGRRWNRGPRWN